MHMNPTEKLRSLLESLRPLLIGVKKYESNIGEDACQSLRAAVLNVDQGLHGGLIDLHPSDISSYITLEFKVARLNTLVSSLQQHLDKLKSQSLPRSSKDQLSTLHLQLLGIKLEVPADYGQAARQLMKVAEDVSTGKADVDVLENQLDDAMRSLLSKLYGTTTLQEEVLKSQLQDLELNITICKEKSAESEAQILSLALNSLQRLHFDQIEMDHSEEEEEPDEVIEDEDDDDDPFFMPMPAAIKMADEGKYAVLAQPIGPVETQDLGVNIVMDDSPSATPPLPSPQAGLPSVRTLSLGAETFPAAPLLDAVPSRTASNAAASDNGVSNAPGESVETHPAALGETGEAAATAAAAAAAATEPSTAAATEEVRSSPTTPPTGLGLASAQEAAAAIAAASTPSDPADPDKAVAPPTEDKLKQFLTFLNGDNPGACMFHAQMRLSVEGCQKLAAFLASSSRVRALSLSHNYLGDHGLRLICEGLKLNQSVTALDLPDNNIGDLGIKFLIEALADNESITQLQLAYNKIGDEGAATLATLIKRSKSLKKLGLAYNNIGKAGCQALTGAINVNQSLKHLQLLPGNPVEDKDAKALAKALKRNKKFSIRTFLGLNEAS